MIRKRLLNVHCSSESREETKHNETAIKRDFNYLYINWSKIIAEKFWKQNNFFHKLSHCKGQSTCEWAFLLSYSFILNFSNDFYNISAQYSGQRLPKNLTSRIETKLHRFWNSGLKTQLEFYEYVRKKPFTSASGMLSPMMSSFYPRNGCSE